MVIFQNAQAKLPKDLSKITIIKPKMPGIIKESNNFVE